MKKSPSEEMFREIHRAVQKYCPNAAWAIVIAEDGGRSSQIHTSTNCIPLKDGGKLLRIGADFVETNPEPDKIYDGRSH